MAALLKVPPNPAQGGVIGSNASNGARVACQSLAFITLGLSFPYETTRLQTSFLFLLSSPWPCKKQCSGINGPSPKNKKKGGDMQCVAFLEACRRHCLCAPIPLPRVSEYLARQEITKYRKKMRPFRPRSTQQKDKQINKRKSFSFISFFGSVPSLHSLHSNTLSRPGSCQSRCPPSFSPPS